MNKKLLEIDEGENYIGYNDAFDLVYRNTNPVGTEEIGLDLCTYLIAAEDQLALVDNPSVDVSLKDGFAVKSFDIEQASVQNPVNLKVVGSAFAGSKYKGVVEEGTAVKICAGSPIPKGAEAVVSDEFCKYTSSQVEIKANAEYGRNILRAGEEIKKGTTIVQRGKFLQPGDLGLMAAAGIHTTKVYRQPKVAVIAIGDEVIAPGVKIRPGQLYASNIIAINAWLTSFGIHCDMAVIKDSKDHIIRELLDRLPDVDAIITSGGAWGSERDLVIGTLDELGWDKKFHHVRMGPGKGIAFGLYNDKIVFCLPGGPASNMMAFLQFALPGLVHTCGQSEHPLYTVPARLTKNLQSRHIAWTEFKYAKLSFDSEGYYNATPLTGKSRLLAIADATCLICIPEGKELLMSGDIINVQVLCPL